MISTSWLSAVAFTFTLFIPSSLSQSDFESSLLLLSNFPSPLCWYYGVTSASIINAAPASFLCEEGPLTAADIATFIPPVIDPDAPVSFPLDNSYDIKMTTPVDNTQQILDDLPKKIKFFNVPASIITNNEFSFIVAYIFEANENVVIVHEPFEIEVEVERAEPVIPFNDAFGSWVLFDLELSGTKTMHVTNGVASFTGLRLNIDSVRVWLKVTETALPTDPKFKNLNAATVNAITVATPIILTPTVVDEADAIGSIPQSTGQTSVFDEDLNRYNANVNAFNELTAANMLAEISLQGPFVVTEFFESLDCDVSARANDLPTSKWYSTFDKVDECIAEHGGLTSSKITAEDPSILTTDIYRSSQTCSGSLEIMVEFRDDCLAYKKRDMSGTLTANSRMISRTTTNVCEPTSASSSIQNPNSRIVRVRNWNSVRTGNGLCDLIPEKPQPTIKAYEMHTCLRTPNTQKSFKFTGCFTANRALLDQYESPDCTGVSSQRTFGDEGGCYVSIDEGWGVGSGGTDVIVECGVSC